MKENNKAYGIVTGASRGLGEACAEELAREGYDIVITYSGNMSKAEAVKQRLEETYGICVKLYCIDIRYEDKVVEMRAWVEREMGTNLAVLINNAGIYTSQPSESINTKDFCDVIDVNVKGTFFMTRYFEDLMINNHFGKIIHLCSAAGLRAAPGSVAYSASKFAVRGMTQAQAIDLGKYNIQVNAIAPGSHKTDMYWRAVKENPELMETRTK